MNKLQVILKKISDVQPADYNPRNITSESLAGLKQSLTEFGFVEPLVVNTRTGNLVGGHQRLKAATELGMQVVPVVEIDLPEEKEKALNITLNNTKISGYFTDGLQDILSDLSETLGEEFLASLKLNELEISNEWSSGLDQVDSTEETLDGILEVIKVRCPQEIKDEVLMLLKRAILESSLEGVEVG